MQGDISRIMVEIAVRQALKNRSKQSFRRSLRTLVEYGEHFSSGPFQSRFFILVQQMLPSLLPAGRTCLGTGGQALLGALLLKRRL